MATPREIGIVARIFVFLVYLSLGLSFLATTAVLAHEFWNFGWFDFVTTDSHLFLFFPTLGIVALIAFYTPSSALADLYWHHVPLGKLRFTIGILLLGAFSYSSLPPPGEPKAIRLGDRPRSAKRRWWRSAGLRACSWRLVPTASYPPSPEKLAPSEPNSFGFGRVHPRLRPRRAFGGNLKPRIQTLLLCLNAIVAITTPASGCRLLSCAGEAQRCGKCTVAHQERRSLTAKVHAWLLPFKVFFLLVLLAISVLLVLRHKAIEQHYKSHMARIEFGVIVGTAAALFFPFMSQAFVQSAEALYGIAGAARSAA